MAASMPSTTEEGNRALKRAALTALSTICTQPVMQIAARSKG